MTLGLRDPGFLGSLDSTPAATRWNQGQTGPSSTVQTLWQESTGTVLAGGNFTNYNSFDNTVRLVKVTGEGQYVSDFNPSPLTGTAFNGVVEDLVPQSDGKVIVSGRFTTVDGFSQAYLAKLNSDGSRDTGFSIGTGFSGTSSIVYPTAIAVQSDGYILVGGYFTSYNGVSQQYFIRLDPTGSLDATFSPNVTANRISSATRIVVQPDGQILHCSGSVSYPLVRYNPDGTNDATWNLLSWRNGPYQGIVYDALVLPDDKILAVGSFTSVGGITRRGIVRLNSDGTIDTSFDSSIGFVVGTFTSVNRVALRPNGKYVACGGYFSFYDGVSRTNIVGINDDGSVDTEFTVGTGFNGIAYDLFVQSTGKIVVGGSFTSYNGQTARYLCRLFPDGTLDA